MAGVRTTPAFFSSDIFFSYMFIFVSVRTVSLDLPRAITLLSMFTEVSYGTKDYYFLKKIIFKAVNYRQISPPGKQTISWFSKSKHGEPSWWRISLVIMDCFRTAFPWPLTLFTTILWILTICINNQLTFPLSLWFSPTLGIIHIKARLVSLRGHSTETLVWGMLHRTTPPMPMWTSLLLLNGCVNHGSFRIFVICLDKKKKKVADSYCFNSKPLKNPQLLNMKVMI